MKNSIKFLIQTIEGKVKHDFSFTLLESIEYNNWFHNESIFKTYLSGGINLPNCVPIGSVEFVSNYIDKYYGVIPKPRNIPLELLDYYWTGRNVINGTEKDIVGTKFVKSNDKIKSFTNICDTAPEGNYQISDLIDIESEWRAFIYEGKLVGLQNYLGEFDVFPNVDKIKEMIKAYKAQPIAFTFDVAISEGNTVIIEVHDFFSCGLYGFSEHKILPYMFSNWYRDFTQELKNK